MRSGLVVVVPASRPNYFELFGIPKGFQIDPRDLEKRFYDLSRQNHPDRFAQAGPQALQKALETMSALNEGYRVLKDRGLLRGYLLETSGVDVAGERSSGTPQGLPMELAEAWFDVQDRVMEGDAGVVQAVLQIEQQLVDLQQSVEARLVSLEREADEALKLQGEAAWASKLQLIGKELKTVSYLTSMLRDVKQLQAKLKG